MSALFFGSMSTLVDTSELQRASFNEAFRLHDLDWSWDQEEYAALLESSGGKDRIASYAEGRGEQVDTEEVHRTKSALFQQELATGPLTPRPGVLQAIEAARAEGHRIGLVTTTTAGNVAALADGLRPVLDLDDFDVVLDNSQVEEPKPSPSVYSLALARLGERAADCVAVEDNLGGVRAATAAGVPCVAFPNANTAGHDFEKAAGSVDALDYAELRALAARS